MGSPRTPDKLHLACQMANDLGGIVRSRHLLLDTPLLTDDQAETLLDRAAQILQHYGVQAHVEAVLARSVADAIIDDARAHRANHTSFQVSFSY